jgi:hypothetical protein
MNLSQRTSLSLLFVSLSAVSANAALSGDNGTADISIENAKQSASLQPLDQLLGGGNHADLFGSVLKQHEGSTQPATSTMEEHFEGYGAPQPLNLPAVLPILASASSQISAQESAQAPNLSLAATVHLGAQAETSPATAASASSSTPTAPTAPTASITPNTPNILTYTTTITPASQFTYTTTITPVNPVPLPAAGLLLASGLIGVTGLRRQQRQE